MQLLLDDYRVGAAVATDLVNTAPEVMVSTGDALPDAAALARFLADPPAPFPAPPVLLVGVLADKDAAAMLASLAPRTGRLVLTRPPHQRGRDPRELLALLPAGTAADVEPDPTAALDHALALTRARATGADTLVVCGSLYLVGAARIALRQRFGVPAD